MGHTIVIVTHEMPIVAAYAQRVVALCEGQILIDGPTRQVFSQPELLRRTFVKPPQVTRLAQAWSDFGMPGDAISIDELVGAMQATRPGAPVAGVGGGCSA